MPLPVDPISKEKYLNEMRERVKTSSNTPEHRQLMRDIANKRWADPKQHEEMSKRMKKRYEDPKEHIKTSIQMKGHGVSEETRKKLRELKTGEKNHNYGKRLPLKTRLKMSESRRLEKHPSWKGGISYGKYCPKFNEEFKERVRAYFGYVCPMCGTPQTDVKLAVHHVNYRKGSCCDPQTPRLFIPLCASSKKTKGKKSCHGITNWNREYWEKYFTDLIMGYYEGKCYLTVEEMAAYNGCEL